MSVFVHREGPADAPTTVLMLHAGASSGAQWARYALGLGPTVRTLAPDLHGHGATPVAPGITAANAIDRMIDDLLPVPQVERFHLVGHSFGGLLAIAMALRVPHRILSLTAVEPACFDALRVGGPQALHDRSRVEVDELVALVERGELEAAMQRVLARWGMGRWDQFSAQQQAVFIDLAPVLLGTGLAAAIRWRCDPAELARLAGVPTLLVDGELSSEVAMPVSETLRAAIPGARRVCIEGAGHMLPMTHRSTLRELLRTQLEPAAAS